VLKKHGVTWSTVRVQRLRDHLQEASPTAAVVHGGSLTPLLMDVQRWLSEADVPTLMLVEGLSDDSEALLLDRGAQDVVVVPAPPRKIGARMEALLRSVQAGPRTSRMPALVTVAEVVQVTPGRRTVTVGDLDVALTKTEFDLLLTLALRRPDVLTKAELAASLGRPWATARALETHVSRVRVKLRTAGAPELLECVRGVGYRLRDA
jgi:DNA-binding response OmpR family regulator